MSKIHHQIEQLRSLASHETNESKLLEEGKVLVEELRKSWKTHKAEFKEEDISSRQKIADQLAAVEEFTVEEEDFLYMSSVEDVDESIGRLYPLVEILDGLSVVGRIHKEIRELIERKKSLPTRVTNQNSIELLRVINKLNNNPPDCKKCDSRMVLREGSGYYFWGCSTFPTCWSRWRLKKEEGSQLEGYL